MKKYLVTGGAGFIGANFVKYILGHHDNAEVLVLDLLTYAGRKENLEPELSNDSRLTFVHGDICDAALVERLIEDFNPDYVVNFAAESHVDRSITDPDIFIRTNVLGCQTLLDACRRAWRHDDGTYSPARRFLQISTDEVYGSLTRDFEIPQPLPLSDAFEPLCRERTAPVTFGRDIFTEETPLDPRSPYSASKAAADMLTRAYGHTYGLPVLVTRCSNNYGPLQHPEKLIPLMITHAAAGKELPVYGRGLNVRDWLYVEDHVAALYTVLRQGIPGRIYNIGGFNEQANIDIVRLIVDEVPGASPEQIRYVTDRPGHDMRYAIDPTRIATELGWVPQTPFDKGIRLTIAHYLSSPTK